MPRGEAGGRRGPLGGPTRRGTWATISDLCVGEMLSSTEAQPASEGVYAHRALPIEAEDSSACGLVVWASVLGVSAAVDNSSVAIARFFMNPA